MTKIHCIGILLQIREIIVNNIKGLPKNTVADCQMVSTLMMYATSSAGEVTLAAQVPYTSASKYYWALFQGGKTKYMYIL